MGQSNERQQPTEDEGQNTPNSSKWPPTIAELPRLSELTLQSTAPIPGGGGVGGGGTTVIP
jgi:hypothetical protein